MPLNLLSTIPLSNLRRISCRVSFRISFLPPIEPPVESSSNLHRISIASPSNLLSNLLRIYFEYLPDPPGPSKLLRISFESLSNLHRISFDSPSNLRWILVDRPSNIQSHLPSNIPRNSIESPVDSPLESPSNLPSNLSRVHSRISVESLVEYPVDSPVGSLVESPSSLLRISCESRSSLRCAPQRTSQGHFCSSRRFPRRCSERVWGRCGFGMFGQSMMLQISCFLGALKI